MDINEMEQRVEEVARAVFALNATGENHNRLILNIHDRLASLEAIVSQTIEDQGGITNIDDDDDDDGDIDPIDGLIREEDADDEDFE